MSKKDISTIRNKNSKCNSVSLGKRILKHWDLYLLLIPGIVITIIFKYIPMYGIQIAFRDYNAVDGFWGSKWVGLDWFTKFFNNYNSSRMISNTLLLSLFTLLWSFPLPIIISLCLNQVKGARFRKTLQTVIYAPHFISIMVLCGIIKIFLSPYGGLFNMIVQAFGGMPIDFLGEPSWFRTIYVTSGIWQDTGWGTILYLATLSGVDTQLYDAAKVDGANKFKLIRHVDIPVLVPIIVIQLIMSFGNLMNVGFEKAFLLQTDLNSPTSDIIATYVYRQGILKAQYSFSTAVGLFNTAVNLVLLFVVNKICKKMSDISFL